MATRTLENVTVSDAYLALMAPYFTVEQHYEKQVEVSGGYGERVTEARQVLPALERAMKAVLVEKRQALLNVVCDVDTNAGGD